MPPSPAGPVLITGCSTGIGRAAAIALHDAGHPVVATARRPETLTELADRGIRSLALDVTDEQSMAAAVRAVEDEFGPVEVLINNAGYGLYGVVEQTPMEEIRRQFETNFFGLVRLTQLVLPGMREARRGRILNVSSMGGRVSLPGGSFYHASKFAVEALSDGLRMEMAPFGVRVVLIEPGPVNTPWNDVAVASLTETDRAAADDDPYAAYKASVSGSFATATAGPLARLGSEAEDVAAVIVTAVTADRPRARYLINAVARTLVVSRAVLPTRAWDFVVRRMYSMPT